MINFVIENTNNYEEFFSYKLLNLNNHSIPSSYNQNTSFFRPILKDTIINEKEYKGVLIYSNVETSNKYFIIKPSEGILYFAFKNDSYELIP